LLVGFTLPEAASAVCTDPGRAAFYGGGTGDAASPYRISTVAHLQALRDRVNAGSNQDGCYFAQTTDLNLAGIPSWVAIGDGSEFHGHYDGGRHRIEGLRISQVDAAVTYYGLFGYVRNGSVVNVRLTDVHINLVFDGVTADRYVGALAARVNSNSGRTTRISTSSVSGALTLTYRGTRDFYAGGLVGRGGTGALLDDRLAFVGQITATLRSTYVGASTREINIGGILGRSSIDTQLSLGYSSADIDINIQDNTDPDTQVLYAFGVIAGSSSSRTSALSELYGVGSIALVGNGGPRNGVFTGAIGFIENALDTFTDIYYLDSILGGFSGGAVDGFDPGVGLINVQARSDAQMRGAAPAGTMTGTAGRWLYRNAPGAENPAGKWFLVLAPGVGEYPYPVFAWEASARPPVDLVATPGNGSINVAFTPGADGGSPVTDYEYQLNDGAWVPAGTVASPVVITGLTNGTAYTVRLRAVTGAGPGAASLPVTATPEASISAPTGLSYADAAPTGVYGTASSTMAPALASDGGEAVTFSIVNPVAVPAGLSVDPVTGVIGWGDDLDAGTYVLTVEARNPAGATEATVTLTIAPLAVAVSPTAAQSKDVGQADPPFSFTTTPVLPEGVLSGALAREPGEAAGDYAFTLGTLGAGTNYALALAGDAATFRIRAAAPRGLSYANATASGVYGTAGMSGSPTLVSNGGAPVWFSIQAPQSVPEGLSIEFSTGMLVWTETLAAGTYPLEVVASNSAGSTSAMVTLTIAPRVLSVVPDAGQSKSFGSADPEFGFTLMPLVTGVPLSGALARELGEAVGEYAFTLGTLAAGPNNILKWLTLPSPSGSGRQDRRVCGMPQERWTAPMARAGRLRRPSCSATEGSR
jgi:hypothetical protein